MSVDQPLPKAWNIPILDEVGIKFTGFQLPPIFDIPKPYYFSGHINFSIDTDFIQTALILVRI